MKVTKVILCLLLFCYIKESFSEIKTLDVPGLSLPAFVETNNIDENTIASKVIICLGVSKSTNTEIITGIQLFTNSQTIANIEKNLIGTCSTKFETYTIYDNKRILKVTFSSNTKEFNSGYTGIRFMLDDKSYSSWYGISTIYTYDLAITGPIIGLKGYIGDDYLSKISLYVTNSGFFYGQTSYYKVDYGSNLAVILAPSIVLGVVFLVGVGVFIYIWCSSRKSSNDYKEEDLELNKEMNSKIKGKDHKNNDNGDIVNGTKNDKKNNNDITNLVIDHENDYNSNLNLNHNTHNTNNFTDNTRNKKTIVDINNNNNKDNNKDNNNKKTNDTKRIDSSKTDFTIDKKDQKVDQKEILLNNNNFNNVIDSNDYNSNSNDNKKSDKDNKIEVLESKEENNNNSDNNNVNNNVDTLNVNVRNVSKNDVKIEGNNKSLYY